MTKVVVGKLNSEKPASKAAVGSKRVRDAEGQMKTLRTLDSGGKGFTEGLRYVFGRNVARAREDNKKVTGARDVDVPRG
jgi:hypothetical protein